MTVTLAGERIRWVVVAMAFALVVGACSGGSSSGSAEADSTPATTPAPTTAVPTATPTTAASTTAAPPTTTEPPRADAIDWGSCAGRSIAEFEEVAPRAVFECATVAAPVDHFGEESGTIDLAVTVLRSAGAAEGGTLFVNPGGPGVGTSELLLSFAVGVFPRDLWDAFDIVAMDPRGVGDSEPEFGCGPSEPIEELLDSIDGSPDTPEEVAAGEAAAAICVEEMGPVAGFIGTREVAADMDLVREAMGEEAISYLGFSYGSTIGVTYASLYPERVRAMVVDGANNPVDEISGPDDLREEVLEEVLPFEEQLGLALDSCSPSCPFGDDPVAALRAAAANSALIEDLFDGSEFAFSAAIVGTLYDEDAWTDLHQGLADLAAGDPSTLEPYAAINIEPDETFPDVTSHVNCIDEWILNPIDRDELVTLYEEAFGGREDELLAQFPLLQAISEGDPDSDLSDLDSGGTGICTFYDVIVGPPLSGPLDGGDVPIVVIGNRSDPFTSFGESKELVDDVLNAGVLVEVDHPQHTVYPQNPCVVDIVHAALIDDVVPDDGVFCEESSAGEVGQFDLVCSIVVDIYVNEAQADPPDDYAAVCDEAEVLVRAELGDEEFERLVADLDSEESGEALAVPLAGAIGQILFGPAG